MAKRLTVSCDPAAADFETYFTEQFLPMTPGEGVSRALYSVENIIVGLAGAA